MGRYVNKTSLSSMGVSFVSKCNALLNDGAVKIEAPKTFQENLVCVMDNGFFAAAGYADSEREMQQFLSPDGRTKQWFIWDKVNDFVD